MRNKAAFSVATLVLVVGCGDYEPRFGSFRAEGFTLEAGEQTRVFNAHLCNHEWDDLPAEFEIQVNAEAQVEGEAMLSVAFNPLQGSVMRSAQIAGDGDVESERLADMSYQTHCATPLQVRFSSDQVMSAPMDVEWELEYSYVDCEWETESGIMVLDVTSSVDVPTATAQP